MEVMKPWITRRVTELLGFEDEVLINFINSLLDAKVIYYFVLYSVYLVILEIKWCLQYFVEIFITIFITFISNSYIYLFFC